MNTPTIIALILCILIILLSLGGLVAVIYCSYRIAKNKERLANLLKGNGGFYDDHFMGDL